MVYQKIHILKYIREQNLKLNEKDFYSTWTQQTFALRVVSLIARDVMTYSQYLFVHWLMCIYVTGGKIHR